MFPDCSRACSECKTASSEAERRAESVGILQSLQLKKNRFWQKGMREDSSESLGESTIGSGITLPVWQNPKCFELLCTLLTRSSPLPFPGETQRRDSRHGAVSLRERMWMPMLKTHLRRNIWDAKSQNVSEAQTREPKSATRGRDGGQRNSVALRSLNQLSASSRAKSARWQHR